MASSSRCSHGVLRPSGYLPNLVQDPLRTGQAIYVQVGSVGECNIGCCHVRIGHLDAAIQERSGQGIVDLMRVIPVQPREVYERLAIVPADDPVRRPQGDSIRGQESQPLP
jgi:hypothetical protein